MDNSIMEDATLPHSFIVSSSSSDNTGNVDANVLEIDVGENVENTNITDDETVSNTPDCQIQDLLDIYK